MLSQTRAGLRLTAMIGVALVTTALLRPESASAAVEGQFASSASPCTFASCDGALGPNTANNGCAFSILQGEQITLGYAFTVPLNAQIGGIVVQVKLGHDLGSSATVQLYKAGVAAGNPKTVSGTLNLTSCSQTAFRTLGTVHDLWGTTWTAEEVNSSLRVRITPQNRTFVDAVRVSVVYTPFPVAAPEQKCVNKINKDAIGVQKAYAIVTNDCFKAGQKSPTTPTGAQDCIFPDRDGKIAKAAAKTAADDQRLCSPPPPFGFTSAGTVNQELSYHSLTSDVFFHLGLAQVLPADDKVGADCQTAVLGGLRKLFEARTKPLTACIKRALKDGASSGPELQSCFDEALAEDLRTAAKATASFTGKITKKCPGGSTFGDWFPGICSKNTEHTFFAECVSDLATCRACDFMNTVGGFDYDCAPIGGGGFCGFLLSP